MRRPLIAGNWKMNTTTREAVNLVQSLKPALQNITNVDMLVCPPFISLVAVHDALAGSPIKIGAQNVYFEQKGAYTGEISVLMLSGVCEYVIVGHSERRQYFNETNEIVSKKLAAILKQGLNPILCVGENLQDYENGKTQDVINQQVNFSLANIEKGENIIVAYEPIWAIGTGKAATGKQSNHTIGFIRSILEKKFGSDVAKNIRILYGGSVTPDNISEFMSQPDIDGALVGGASLKADQFIDIIKNTSATRGR